MSWNPTLDPTIPIGNAVDAIETVIVPRSHDLGGGFEVRRALPTARRQMVGPFIFFDHFGPAEILRGQGVDIRPHPHIGLATVTYLLKGRMHHRDSLGTDAWIAPGEVNLMQAGIGITHSERVDGPLRDQAQTMLGLQTWLALSEAMEDAPPAFFNKGVKDLPVLEGEGKVVRLILGDAWGQSVDLPLSTETFYADVTLGPNAAIPLPDNHEERGIYLLSGEITQGGVTHQAPVMLVVRPGDRMSVKAGARGARLMLLGGASMPGPRFIWWNFVASTKERILAAKEAWRAGDWKHGRFQLPPGDDGEFIPAPER